MTKFYCQDTYTALLHYTAIGMPPGSFGLSLLSGDLDLAYQKAHKLLVPLEKGGHGETDVVLNMMELVEQRLPPVCRGESVQKWINHNGYSDATDEEKALFIIFADTKFLKKITSIVREEQIRRSRILKKT